MTKAAALKAVNEALRVIRSEKQKQNAPGINNESINLSRLITELLLLENALSSSVNENLLTQLKKP